MFRVEHVLSTRLVLCAFVLCVGSVGAVPAAARRPASAPGATATMLNERVRTVVASIAGAEVRLVCVAPDNPLYEALGHADWQHREIELAPPICRGLSALAVSTARPYTAASFTQAQALLVLVHESVHLSDYSGRTNEALTECRAIQLVREAALELGIDDATARALGHEALHFDAQLPGLGDWRVGLHEIPNYHAADCYDGGPLDIHPNSTDWPN